jgi:hypothetical protein
VNGVAQAAGNRLVTVNVASSDVTVEAEFCDHIDGTITPFGTGCVGSNGIPSHTSTSVPNAGTTVTYRAGNLPTAATATLWLGFSNTVWNGIPLPLSLGIIGADPSCNLLIGREGSFPVTVTGSTGTSSVPLPSWLPIGTDIYTQVLVLDFFVPSPLKLTVSNALHTRTGGDACN